jgi:heme A synthase
MLEATQTDIPASDRQTDRALLWSLSLSPLAAGINTIVGFIVAHWITVVAYKRTGYLVSAFCFALCVVAAVLAWNARPVLIVTDETFPEDGRRLFMSKLGMLLAVLCAIVVLAGTLVLVTLGPSD